MDNLPSFINDIIEYQSGFDIKDPDNQPPMFNYTATLRGKNTIHVMNSHALTTHLPQAVFRCDLGSLTDTNVRTPKSMQLLTDIVVAGVQAYIFNNYVVSNAVSSSFGGIESSAISDRVSRYEDAEEQYKELLRNKWGKNTLMDDPTTVIDLVSLQVGGLSLGRV